MAYEPLRVGEMLYATRDAVPVFTSPGLTSPRSLTNNEHNDHTLREYVNGEPIGTVLDATPFSGPDGTQFIKIQNWVWIWKDVGIVKLGWIGHNEQEFHENYVNVADEPDGWIRDTWRQLNLTVTETSNKSAEISTALKDFPGVPAPTSIEKHTSSTGVDTWWVTFANGYTADFDTFIKLTAENKITLTTRAADKSGLLDTTTSLVTPKSKTKTSVFTTTNILIGVGVLGLFGLLLTLLLRKKK